MSFSHTHARALTENINILFLKSAKARSKELLAKYIIHALLLIRLSCFADYHHYHLNVIDSDTVYCIILSQENKVEFNTHSLTHTHTHLWRTWQRSQPSVRIRLTQTSRRVCFRSTWCHLESCNHSNAPAGETTPHCHPWLPGSRRHSCRGSQSTSKGINQPINQSVNQSWQ